MDSSFPVLDECRYVTIITLVQKRIYYTYITRLAATHTVFIIIEFWVFISIWLLL